MRLEDGEVVVPQPAAASPGRRPWSLWPSDKPRALPPPFSPPHSQILSPSTCEHSFNELGWFSFYLGKEVSEISWFCAEGAWGSVSLQLYKRINLDLHCGSSCGCERSPVGAGVCHHGDHQVEDCFLPTQVLVTMTPASLPHASDTGP